MSFVTFIERQDRRVVLAEAFVLLLLVGLLDYATGRELSVSLFYAIVVLMVAWNCGARSALGFALLCSGIWWLANVNVHPYGGNWGYAWATFSRLVTFVFVAKAGAAVRAKQESDRLRIEALERAKALEHDIARISEHEQRRIGQDLHDGICQELAAIRCAISSLRDDFMERGLSEASSAGEVADMIGHAIVEVRNLARGIFPVQMEGAGLAAVLDELVATTRRLYRLPVSFEMQGEVNVSEPEVAMHLYRIAQEALSNAVKHASASHIAVRLGVGHGYLSLDISDDGVGFQKADGNADGMGLRTMQYRAELIGAKLEVDERREGVTISCRLPLSPPSTFPS